MKKLLLAFLVVALSLCMLTGCDPDAEEIDWVNIKLGHVLPEPQSKLMKIVSNEEDDLLVYIHNISQNQYLEYQRWCEQDKGFNIDVESLGSSFYAYNHEGYYLSLFYSDSQDEMHVTLNAPIPMEEYELPEFAIAAGLPVPESKMGHFNWQNENSFFLYVGETAKDAYMLYKDACVAAGFTSDPYEYDVVYSATNAEGYKVSLNYKGFNTFTLEFKGPTSESDDNTGSDAEEYTIDYTDAASFEAALNSGVKVNGKIVKFDVVAYKPDSALGINCWSGEHLNFISKNKLDVVAGDIIVGYITREPSKALGSWEIHYEPLLINDEKTGATIPSKPEETTPPETTEPTNTAGAPDVWTSLLEKHYEDVKKKFEDAGFTNITCVAHEIDYNENNTFEGSVVNIAIGENGEICTFEKGEQWPKDIKIRIDYRVKPAVTEKPDTTKIVLPEDGSKLSKDFDSEGTSTIYYINVDGTANKPSIKTWESATVTDGVAEYLDYLKGLGFTITITSSSHKEPYSGFHVYETDFNVSNSSVSWTMYLCIQKEKYVEYELDIHKDYPRGNTL